MCNVCDRNKIQDGRSMIEHEPFTDVYLIKTIGVGGWVHTKIKYCPFCGRELK